MRNHIPAMATRRRKKKPPNAELMELAERTKSSMRAMGYEPDKHGDQLRFARAAKLSQPQVNRLLRLETFPRHDFIARLAIALGVRPAWLLWNEPPRSLRSGVELDDPAFAEHLAELVARKLRNQS